MNVGSQIFGMRVGVEQSPAKLLPAVTGILPWLTPLAATGLVLTMIGAMFTHGRRGEYSQIGVNVVLLLLALFVAYGRFVIVPIS